MEDFISAGVGSDGSNLSPTQENDPSVYARFLPDEEFTNSLSSGNTRRHATQDLPPHSGLEMIAPDTGRSYGVDDTGHLTLDYQPPAPIPIRYSFEEVETGDVSHVQLGTLSSDPKVIDPRTPSQPKLILGRPGTVFTLSQMFAETQPSPGSHGRQAGLPSSSRPSPDIFNQRHMVTDVTSSPLIQRGNTDQSDMVGADLASSPPNPPEKLIVLGNSSQPPRSIRPYSCSKDQHNPFSSVSFHHLPEPYDVYTSRKESQERRRREASAHENIAQSSDDGFSDDDRSLIRRAKLKKEQAAKALAVIGTPRTSITESNVVEVPSTSNGRRRSLAEDYIAQCSGLDARDTQDSETVEDSQSGLPDQAVAAIVNASQISTKKGSDNSSKSGHVDPPQEPSVAPNTVDVDSSGHLPGLDQNEDSEATESERELSSSPTHKLVTQPLGEVSSNELRTPALNRKSTPLDVDAIVPETSPSEAHLQKYGEIVSQTPPVLSAEYLDDGFNPLTQDGDFNEIFRSPTPQKKTRSRPSRLAKAVNNSNLEVKFMEVAQKDTGDDLVNPESTGLVKSKTTAASNFSSTAQEGASEYVTAPTDIPPESLGPSNEDLEEMENISTEAREDPTSKVAAVPDPSCDLEITNTSSRASEFQPSTVVTREESRGSVPAKDVQDHGRDLRKDSNSVLRQVPIKVTKRDSVRARSKSMRRNSSRLLNEIASHNPDGISAEIQDKRVNVVEAQSETVREKLRSASQVKGSSRALRRMTAPHNESSRTSTPRQSTPASTSKTVPRSSRRGSVQCKFCVIKERCFFANQFYS